MYSLGKNQEVINIQFCCYLRLEIHYPLLKPKPALAEHTAPASNDKVTVSVKLYMYQLHAWSFCSYLRIKN